MISHIITLNILKKINPPLLISIGTKFWFNGGYNKKNNKLEVKIMNTESNVKNLYKLVKFHFNTSSLFIKISST